MALFSPSAIELSDWPAVVAYELVWVRTRDLRRRVVGRLLLDLADRRVRGIDQALDLGRQAVAIGCDVDGDRRRRVGFLQRERDARQQRADGVRRGRDRVRAGAAADG